MMGILCLLLFLCPALTMAQAEMKNGTITFDFGKKKQVKQDTSRQLPATTEEKVTPKPKKEKKQSTTTINKSSETNADSKRNGLFSGLFHAGFNACQVDGDNEWGYKYIGAAVGIGALARFHPWISVSMELNYSMKGAKARLLSTPQVSRRFAIQWDFVEAPVLLNVHYKELLMISAGLATGYMVRYKELDDDGIDKTANPLYGQPKKIDLCFTGGVHFIIKKHFAIGCRFSYSTLKLRGAYPNTRVNGQYNNYFTLRFMYILNADSKAKKKL